MSGSNITGELPLSWGYSGSLSALIELDLSHNSITGVLPASWSVSNSLPQLRSLILTDNLLGGALPSSWGSQSQAFPSLEMVDVASNSLTGTLPAAWCGEGFPVSPAYSLAEICKLFDPTLGQKPISSNLGQCFVPCTGQFIEHVSQMQVFHACTVVSCK